MEVNKILEFIGSKWFIAILGIAMIFVLPTTFSNLMIVFDAGEMGRLWWVPTIFVINLLSAVMCFYKAAGMFFTKKNDDKEEWN